MKKQLTKADLFWPMALVAIISLTGIVFAGLGLIRQFDLAAREREQLVVANGINGRVRETAQMLAPQVVWDDAVRHLDNRFDPAWANENIGQFLHQVDGFQAAFVLSSADRPLYASEAGRQASLHRWRAFAPQARSLVERVRRAEAARGALPKTSRGKGMVGSPIHSSSIVDVDGAFYILTATLVQPDFGLARPSGARAPVVVAAMPIDEAFLAAYADRFMLKNLHMHPGDARGEAAEAHAALHNDRGGQVATLDWTPQNPGETLLRNLAAPILLTILVLGAVVAGLYARSRRMAQGLIASEARAAHLAYYDSLTGLPNRVLFFDRLASALGRLRRSRRSLAVLCIDLDRFKEVNDTWGHHAGDQLIQEAAHRMAAECRAVDTISRLSGDEFAIVLNETDAAGAAGFAERLNRAMCEPFELVSGRVFIGCSIGVSMIEDGDLEPAEALRQADMALYRAKQSARGQYSFFEPEMDAAIKTRRMMEQDLRQALANGELSMAYQPQVNRRGVMIGVEALVRWEHPTRGAISPVFFVPVAEECGLIVELGMFTLRRAFEDSRRWPGLKVAINISANQIRLKDFVDRLGDLVRETAVDPRHFELEITEGVLLGDDPDTHETLRRLRAMGFALALDDFGTGYSSLSYLQRFPISKIKIDRSFISNLGVDDEADAVVGAIVKLARALKLSVIAEGVETREQRARLAEAGCSEIQGYLFCKPIAAGEIAALRLGGGLAMGAEAA